MEGEGGHFVEHQPSQVYVEHPIVYTHATVISNTTMATTSTTSVEPVQEVDLAASSRTVFIILLASLVELVAAAHICDVTNYCKKEFGFAVAVGTLGFFFSSLFLLVLAVRKTLSSSVVQIFAGFMLVLWSAGAGVSTFRDPFKATGNGFFSSWLAFVQSCQFAYVHIPILQRFVHKLSTQTNAATQAQKIIVVLFAASAIELTAAATTCIQSNSTPFRFRAHSCTDQISWAISIGAISTWTSLVCLFEPSLQKVHIAISALLALLWVPGVGVLTFDSPFVYTGNGYFSSWIAFVASAYWFYVSLTTSNFTFKFPTFGGGQQQQHQQTEVV
eukprot:c3900_g1_i1.p1 GENE.c3900_g1_i1~~c3900_g1_i1.p1  ORF type:complete len:331 (+),score=85.26 c3900_g1_i1:35-1027(+)